MYEAAKGFDGSPMTIPIQRGRTNPALARMVVFVLAAYCSIGAAVVIGHSVRLLNNTWENAFFESPQTNAALYAVRTGKLYIPMSEPPYTPQAYTPLYYAIDAVVAWLAHSDIDRFILYARVMTFLAYLLCGLVGYLICRAAGFPAEHSVLAALMMLAHPDFFGWNISPRPDMLYLLAMLLSLLCALKWAEREWLGPLAAGFLGGIAFLIKQPGLTVVAAIFIILLIQKELKKAAILTASTVAPVVAVICVLYWRRDPFLQQLSFVGNSLWSVSNTLQVISSRMITWHWIVPALIGLIGFHRAVRTDIRSRMIASFAAMCLVMGFVTLPQIGGYVNYLLPALAGCGLLLPYAIQEMESKYFTNKIALVAAAALILATWSSTKYLNGLVDFFVPPSRDSLSWLQPYRVLSDLTTMNMHGRDPELLDPFGAHVLELTGHWDATPVIQNLQQRKYDLIIFTRVSIFHIIPNFRGISYLGPAETKALNENYEMLCSTVRRMVMKPRGREIPLTPEFFSRVLGGNCRVTPPGHTITLTMAVGSQ